ncbi:DinB family protein [Oerskovia enterophila]|uniref:DinB superfamily protein n=1 Tax=Oerskovia enterophila TaxID=43678 RepID=A0A168E2M9_9CELL|nr:DinB family protein [Oerskovia enterophila]KZM35385.1 DinB superfamily protein [Oerskovia enterophila]
MESTETGAASAPTDAVVRPDHKATLHRYLQAARDALVWKLEGLDERAARWPWTPTGTNLLGLVKHAAGVEFGYFGQTFGRGWPTPDDVPWMAEDAADGEDNADMWATAEESIGSVVDLYRRVWAFADETIATLDLDATGRVPWWPDDRSGITLLQVMVHVTSDLARHAGHADILRELTDGSAGLRADNDNLPPLSAHDWSAHVERLRAVADEAQHRADARRT